MDINSEYDKYKRPVAAKKTEKTDKKRKPATSKEEASKITSATEKYYSMMGSVIKDMEVKTEKSVKQQKYREHQKLRKERIAQLERIGYARKVALTLVEDDAQFNRLMMLIKNNIDIIASLNIAVTVQDEKKIQEILELVEKGISPNAALGIIKNYDSAQKERFLALYEGGHNAIESMVLSSIEDKERQEKAISIQSKGLFIGDAAHLVKMYDDDADLERAVDLTKRGISVEDTVYASKDENKYSKIIKLKDKGSEQNVKHLMTLFKYSNISVVTLPYREKRLLISSIEELLITESQSDLFSDEERKQLLKTHDNIQATMKQSVIPTEVTQSGITEMMKGFFANNNPDIEQTISNTDFSKFGKEGIPLIYPRKDYIKNLKEILAPLPQTECKIILNKLGITLANNNNGYDGIINLDKLDKTNETEKEVYDISRKFIMENKADTGDKDLDNALNSLFKGMPEFINIVGKQQHPVHELSLDSHILKVMQEVIKNEDYNKLSNIDKTVLKFAVIMHDIAKEEANLDGEHPEMSALYAKDILTKYKLPVRVKDRIFELIKNHHWLEKFDKGIYSPSYTASLFRHQNDYMMAKIMANADLKGVNEAFYKKYAGSLEDTRQYLIESAINRINTTGQIMFSDKVIKPDLLPTVDYNNQTYKVVDFTKIPEKADMNRYGFCEGTTKNNFRLFLHMTEANNLDTLEQLQEISNGGFLCTSFVSIDKCITYGDKRFGVSMESEMVNIANASIENQTSGFEKDFEQFRKIITNQYGTNSYRGLIPERIQMYLSISSEEYKELYKQMSSKNYISQIKDDDIIKLKNKEIKGSDIKQAIRYANDALLMDKQNEVNLYNPKINAVVAKVNSLKEVPQKYLDFAQKHDLPIYLLGSNISE
ncbi:hypothetical protein IJ182_09025 [bacterium]|nr:hypothetical protein [bacterium]